MIANISFDSIISLSLLHAAFILSPDKPNISAPFDVKRTALVMLVVLRVKRSALDQKAVSFISLNDRWALNPSDCNLSEA